MPKVKAEWFDIKDKQPRQGQTVSLLGFGGKVYQAKRNSRYFGGFEILNCAGGECTGEHWGRYWSPSYVSKPDNGNW